MIGLRKLNDMVMMNWMPTMAHSVVFQWESPPPEPSPALRERGLSTGTPSPAERGRIGQGVSQAQAPSRFAISRWYCSIGLKPTSLRHDASVSRRISVSDLPRSRNSPCGCGTWNGVSR
jgi:hypothetical protein